MGSSPRFARVARVCLPRMSGRARGRLRRVGRRLLAGSLLALAASAGAQSADWQVSHEARSDRVVLRYREHFQELRSAADPGPELVVRGDGRATLHVPPYMKRAGDYELDLSQAELRELLRDAVRRGLFDFDAAKVRDDRRRSQRQRRSRGEPLHERSEDAVTQIELSLTSLRSPDGRQRRDVEVRVEWPGVRGDARRFPEVRALTDLGAFERQLRAFLDRPDWVRVASGGTRP